MLILILNLSRGAKNHAHNLGFFYKSLTVIPPVSQKIVCYYKVPAI